VLAFGAFAGAAVTYGAALFQADHPSVIPGLPQLTGWAQASLPVLSPLVALTGALGVFCSVMLYQSTRRRYWNGPATSFKFALTSVMLGLAFSTAAAAIVLALTHADPLPLLEPWLDFAWPMLAAATVLKLAGELAVIRHLRAAGAGDLKRSARLLVGELGSLLGLRTGLALLGGVILPAAFFGASGDVPFVAQLTVALLSAALLLAGELLERVLFFAAMSAPRMPGVVG